MPSDSVIQLPPDSTGQKVAVRKVTNPSPVDSAGAAVADVAANQQIIALADRRGDPSSVEDALLESLSELRSIRELLEVISLKLE